MRDRQHPDLLAGEQVPDVVRETANSGLAEDKVIADIGNESARIRPANDDLDGIFDGSQEGEADSVATILIPKGASRSSDTASGSKRARRVTQPARQPAAD